MAITPSEFFDALKGALAGFQWKEPKSFSVPKVQEETSTVMALPPDWQVKDLRPYMPHTDRITQVVEMLTVEAFTSYLNRFKNATSSVFADETTGTFRGVLDYHESNPAKYQPSDHVITYACPVSDRWTTWVAGHDKWMSQQQFGEFLETNLPDIAGVDAGKFLQMALQFQVHKGAEFESDTRLDNGQVRLKYNETIRTVTKPGEMEVPTQFQISIPVFVDGVSFPITCRFKYRLTGPKLELQYQLVRHKDVWRAAVKEVSAAIQKATKGVFFYAATGAA